MRGSVLRCGLQLPLTLTLSPS